MSAPCLLFAKTLSERKRKFQAELQRRDDEMEELRRSSQQEQEKLWAQLRKARSSTDHSVADQVCVDTEDLSGSAGTWSGTRVFLQMCQMRAELEEEWKERCRQALANAQEYHSTELAELQEQRGLLQEQLRELQQQVGPGS